MNSLFATWHKEVSINLVGVDVPARAAAADGLAAEVDGARVLDLVAVACGHGVDQDADEWLRQPFQQAEPAFAMRGNDSEMQVLAAAVLEEVCRTGSVSKQVLAGYAIAVAEHKGLDCPIAELPATAATVLSELAVSMRTPEPRPALKPPLVWSTSLKTLVDAYPDGTYDTALLKALFQKVAESAQTATLNLANQVNTLVDWSEHNGDIAAEDTVLLWWLLSGRSATLDAQWASLPTQVLAVVAGRELASACSIVPAPPQSESLLQQIISANPQPKKPADVAVPALETPEPLAFLVADIPNDSDPLCVARHSLNQAMLLRAWDELQ